MLEQKILFKIHMTCLAMTACNTLAPAKRHCAYNKVGRRKAEVRIVPAKARETGKKTRGSQPSNLLPSIPGNDEMGYPDKQEIISKKPAKCNVASFFRTNRKTNSMKPTCSTTASKKLALRYVLENIEYRKRSLYLQEIISISKINDAWRKLLSIYFADPFKINSFQKISKN